MLENQAMFTGQSNIAMKTARQLEILLASR